MAIIKTDETNYYELDWYVPTEDLKKVYIALKGKLDKNIKMEISNIYVGYEWKVEKNAKFKRIDKKEFIEKADDENIVYFFGKSGDYNELLNYPENLQKGIDIELLRLGYKPHGKVSIKDQLKVYRQKYRNKKEFQRYQKSLNKNKSSQKER